MRIAQFMLGTILIGVLVETTRGTGHGYVDPATPPACAPDGSCYPKRETWGYYPGRWRTWPGAMPDVRAEPRADELLRPDLRPYITPPPVEEDLASPPPTQQRPPVRPIAPPPEETTPEAPAETPVGPRGAPPQETPPVQTTPTPLPDAGGDQDLPPSFEFPDLPDPGEEADVDSAPEVTKPESDDLFDLQSFDDGEQSAGNTPKHATHSTTEDPPPVLPDELEQLGNYQPAGAPITRAAVPTRSNGVSPAQRQWRQFDPGVIPAGFTSSSQTHMRSMGQRDVQAEHTTIPASSAKSEVERTSFFSWSKMLVETR